MQRLLQLPLLLLLALTLTLPAMAQDDSWMTDVTAEVGLDDQRGFRISIADLNGDFYPDVILHNGSINGRNQLSLWLNLRNPAGGRMFVDVTAESNINEGRVEGEDGRLSELVTFADLDNDGDLDMASGVWYWNRSTYDDKGDRHEIMLNDGSGTFTLVEDSGLPELGLIPATQFAWVDYDMNGILDLYMSVFSLNHQLGQFTYDRLLRGDGNGKFEDVSIQAGMSFNYFPHYGGNVTDWNNDGWPDLISSSYCRDGGTLWSNNGDGTFTDATRDANYSSQHMTGDVDASGPRALCQWEAMPADFDNDGDIDLAQILVHGGLGSQEGRTTLAVNGGPEANYRLEWERERLVRKGPASVHMGDQDAIWFDLENDGLLDLVVSQSVYIQATDRMYIFNQQSDNTFEDITGQLGLITEIQSTHAMEPFDFDLDGDDDLLVAKWRRGAWEPENRDRVVLLRNDVAHKNNWIGIKLAPEAEGTNRSAIGARIYVHSGGTTQIRDIQAGRGHFGGQQPLIRNFGLGQATEVDSVVVRWPAASFPTTTVVNPTINEIAVINEDGWVRVITSVEDGEPVAQAQTEMRLFPNPAGAVVHAGLPTSWLGSQVEITVVDALGRVLIRQSVAGAQARLPIRTEALTRGYYTVQVTRADGATLAASLVKG